METENKAVLRRIAELPTGAERYQARSLYQRARLAAEVRAIPGLLGLAALLGGLRLSAGFNWSWVGIVGVVAASGAVCYAVKRYWADKTSQRVIQSLRTDVSGNATLRNDLVDMVIDDPSIATPVREALEE